MDYRRRQFNLPMAFLFYFEFSDGECIVSRNYAISVNNAFPSTLYDASVEQKKHSSISLYNNLINMKLKSYLRSNCSLSLFQIPSCNLQCLQKRSKDKNTRWEYHGKLIIYVSDQGV